nr:paraquat-inducible protein A [Spongiibacter nanhainus]
MTDAKDAGSAATPNRLVTAKQQGLARCDHCGLLCRVSVATSRQHAQCPRCGAALHYRRRRSLQRCWALCLAATLLLIPANVLPIMTVINFGQGDPDTIISGVVKLWQSGLWGIASVVFIASVIVPFVKIAILVSLMLVVHWRLALSPRQCMILYRFVHLIGRWSMLDLFMISILATVVHMGNIALVEAGPGATAFAAVVVLTMLAANQLDPRLLWDQLDPTPKINDGNPNKHTGLTHE